MMCNISYNNLGIDTILAVISNWYNIVLDIQSTLIVGDPTENPSSIAKNNQGFQKRTAIYNKIEQTTMDIS
jgi:hypothetical protein